METYYLHFTLKSDTTFGRGDGLAGDVDREVTHDAQGFPYLNGRTIKGLLTEECDALLEVLETNELAANSEALQKARWWLFGQPGSRVNTTGALRIGRGQLSAKLRQAVVKSGMKREDVLASLTTVRRQSAIDPHTGAPEKSTLRAMRVVLRETSFVAEIKSPRALSNVELTLLAVSVLHWRRAGSVRNRGRGRLIADLKDTNGNSLLREGMSLLEVQP
jgi:hypothetical protein